MKLCSFKSISMNTMIHQAYGPEAFRRNGHELIDLLAEHLTAVQAREGAPAIPFTSPEEEYAFWQKDYQENKGGSPSELFQAVLDRSVRVQNPRYMGHQISPAAPLAALASLVDGLLNNGMGVYEMGAAGTAIERLVVKMVAGKMGFGEAADGVMTSGGTLANLTALLAARSVKAPASVWRQGHQDKLALLVSEEAHYCVDRALSILGRRADHLAQRDAEVAGLGPFAAEHPEVRERAVDGVAQQRDESEPWGVLGQPRGDRGVREVLRRDRPPSTIRRRVSELLGRVRVPPRGEAVGP